MGKELEQFKKWFNKESDDGREVHPSSYDDCKDAWKAALENVLQNEFVTNAIYKELEG